MKRAVQFGLVLLVVFILDELVSDNVVVTPDQNPLVAENKSTEDEGVFCSFTPTSNYPKME